MDGWFNDGRTARSCSVSVRLDGEVLVFDADADGERRWPLAAVRVETVDDRVRLALGQGDPARLVLMLADWRGATAGAVGHQHAQRRRHLHLVLGLSAVALCAAAVVFVGIPAASGPLARRTSPELERKIGDNMDSQVSLAFRPCGGEPGQAALRRLGGRLQSAAHTPFDIRVRAVHAPMVNAFALPGGSVMVTDELIDLTATPDELAAVVAHEAAHVEKRHVMQAVWRSFGFGVLLDALVGGGSGAGQQAVLLMGSFTNLRYSREAEAEADAAGQDLLQAQGLSSQGMSPFFRRLTATSEGRNAEAVKTLLSDHPDTLRRAQMSASRARPGATAFTPAEWTAIKATCRDGRDPLRRIRKFF